MKAKDVTDAHLSLQLFPGYTEADTAIFGEFANPGVKPEPGFLVDFLGSRIRTTSLWKAARSLDGHVLGHPIPADFHAEAIEWIGLLKAVRGASGQYVAMELGAGFGPWVIAGAVAARFRGVKDIRLYAVEGDPEHFRFLRQHFEDNDFQPDQHALLEAAVGTKVGVAQWPIAKDSSEIWGSRAIPEVPNRTEGEIHSTKPINVIPMRDLVMKEPQWDLIHIDVQGDEVDVCGSCIDELNARVRWIVVGTHSRKIDGDLVDLMHRAGWLLEHEKPTKFTFSQSTATLEAMTTLDGTQVWRNPRLIRRGDALISFAQEITSAIDRFCLKAGAAYCLDVTVKNIGTHAWYGGRQPTDVAAGYRWFDSTGALLTIEGERTQLDPAVIQPGESSALQLQILAPLIPGSYTIWVSMVQEGVSWFFDRGGKALVLTATVD